MLTHSWKIISLQAYFIAKYWLSQVIFFFGGGAMLCGMQDIISPTRDGISALSIGSVVLTAGPPGKPPQVIYWKLYWKWKTGWLSGYKMVISVLTVYPPDYVSDLELPRPPLKRQENIIPYITNLRKDQNPKFKVQFLSNAYWLSTTVKSNHP